MNRSDAYRDIELTLGDEETRPRIVQNILDNLESDLLSVLNLDADGPPSIFERSDTLLGYAWRIVRQELGREAVESQEVADDNARDAEHEAPSFHPWRGLARDAD